MNNRTKQVLFGSLLGDGSITNENPARYCEKHSLKQKDYLVWKKQIVQKDFVFGKIFYDRKRKIISIRTNSDAQLTFLRRLFYLNNGTKAITFQILKQLSPLALAVWYCDDGTYRYMTHRCSISSYNLGYRKHLLIKKYFKKKWLIDCNICFDSRKKYYLEIDAENTRRFIKLIKTAFVRYRIPRCMWYKLGHLFEGNQDRIKRAKNDKREDSRRCYQKLETRLKKRKYYLKNKSKILKQVREYQAKSGVNKRIKKYMKEYAKEYRRKNRNKINRYKRDWRRKRKILGGGSRSKPKLRRYIKIGVNLNDKISPSQRLSEPEA